jgi:lipoate---protein ligase
MRFAVNSSTDPYFNMAFDEYCLQQYGSDEDFFYLWRNRPAVIIGLNQNAYAEVNLDYLNSHGITLARRVTGGGAVYHDLQNLNYTFVGRSVTPEPFAQALRSLGVPAEVSGRNDIFVDGRKVSGYARRVWHEREIVHGTLMYDVDIDTLTKVLDVPGSKMDSKGIASVRSRVANLKDYLPQFASLDELQAALSEILAGGDGQLLMTPADLAGVQRAADEKFSTWDWIYGHSREADFRRRARLVCGTVEAGVSIDRGRITGLEFSGDFLGDEPASRLAALLVGVRFEEEEIISALQPVRVQDYFSGVDAASLAALLTRA